jgi:hypothetical protein
VLCYKKQDLLIIINAGDSDYEVKSKGIILFENKYEDGVLKKDGTVVIKEGD